MIRKYNLIFLLISSAFFVDVFISNEIAFLIMFLALSLVFLDVPVTRGFLLLLVPVMIGGVLGLFSYSFANVIKDIWYFFKPFVYFVVAYIYGVRARDSGSVETTIYIICLISLSMFIGKVLFSSSGLADFIILRADDFRDVYGKGSILFVLGFIYSIKMSGDRHKWFYKLFAAMFVLGLLISQSRFFNLCIFIYLFCKLIPWYELHAKIIFSSILVMLLLSMPNYDLGGLSSNSRDSLMDKVLFSIDEIQPRNFILDVDIHNRWRGYETFKAMDLYLDGRVDQIIFGRGLGAAVDIDFGKRAGSGSDELLYALEWLHNGYVTIILKTGIVGLLAFIYLIFIWLGMYRKNYYKFRVEDLVGLSIYIFLIYYFLVSTYLMGGLFSKGGLLIPLFLFGFMSGRYSKDESAFSTSRS